MDAFITNYCFFFLKNLDYSRKNIITFVLYKKITWNNSFLYDQLGPKNPFLQNPLKFALYSRPPLFMTLCHSLVTMSGILI